MFATIQSAIQGEGRTSREKKFRSLETTDSPPGRGGFERVTEYVHTVRFLWGSRVVFLVDFARCELCVDSFRLLLRVKLVPWRYRISFPGVWAPRGAAIEEWQFWSVEAGNTSSKTETDEIGPKAHRRSKPRTRREDEKRMKERTNVTLMCRFVCYFSLVDPPSRVAGMKKKTSLTIRESAVFLANNSYLRDVAMLVIGYGTAINIVEGKWFAGR